MQLPANRLHTRPRAHTGRPAHVLRLATGFRLAGYSFLILFVELALIRYVAAYVRVFGFFVNFVVVATFLGMGVGLLQSAAAARLRWLAPPALLLVLGLVKLFSGFLLRTQFQTEALWEITTRLPHEIGVVPAVLILFVACAILFLPLGASMGREFGRFRPLTAYTIDVAGSLAGILAFGAMSLLHSTPVAWFGVALAVWISVAAMSGRHGSRLAIAMALTAIPAMILVSMTASPGERWSPYYRITTRHVRMTTDPHPTDAAPRGIAVEVNGALHQYMIDLNVPSLVRECLPPPV